MKPEEVAQFHNQHPEFFEDYAEMLSEVVIPHPHGVRAIPISERQILSLREKSRRLESKLGELIRFGEQNDAITDKLHRMTVGLIGARDVAGVVNVLSFNLREDFAVPHVAVRLWESFASEAESYGGEPSGEARVEPHMRGAGGTPQAIAIPIVGGSGHVKETIQHRFHADFTNKDGA